MAASSSQPEFGGASRFELELEFVSALANPYYLQFLATQKRFDDPRFVNYLRYLLYWKEPPYLKYLNWPGPTLNHLELLQHERFRQDIILPDVVNRLVDESMKAAVEWHRQPGGRLKEGLKEEAKELSRDKALPQQRLQIQPKTQAPQRTQAQQRPQGQQRGTGS